MQVVWPHQTFDLAAISHGLGRPDHVTHAAINEDNTIVGFVDGFLTTSQEGQRRWEVDLLAVHPEYHGQGIGRALVAANTEQGRFQNAERARALTAIDNTPAHRTFQKCGYVTDSQAHTLLISTGKAAGESSPRNAHYVYVNTLNYRGIWIEGEITQDALAAAQTLCFADQRDIAGVLIPAGAKERIAVAQSIGYEIVGQYIWQCLDL